MRKALLMALACLLLAGCGGTGETLENAAPEETANTLPATAPVEPISAPAVVTEGRTPEKAYELPTGAMPLQSWVEDRTEHPDAAVCLLAEEPEKEAALYLVEENGSRTLLIRWEDRLAEFDWSLGGPLLVNPQFHCWDVDSDGQDEVIVINSIGSGTGVSVDELHVVEKSPDGTLTDNCFPASLWQDDLSGLLSAAVIGNRTYAILGTELVDITADTAYADLETLQYGTGSIANFSASPPAGESGGVLSFRGAFLIAWEGHPSGAYVADTTADIFYENGTFTLSEFHLDSNQSTRKE